MTIAAFLLLATAPASAPMTAQAAAARVPAQAAALPVAAALEAPAASAALGLIERDWVLMGWALKYHDRDHDGRLEPAEAADAAADFRRIADGDGDGRVSRLEYHQARDFIIARY